MKAPDKNAVAEGCSQRRARRQRSAFQLSSHEGTDRLSSHQGANQYSSRQSISRISRRTASQKRDLTQTSAHLQSTAKLASTSSSRPEE